MVMSQAMQMATAPRGPLAQMAQAAPPPGAGGGNSPPEMARQGNAAAASVETLNENRDLNEIASRGVTQPESLSAWLQKNVQGRLPSLQSAADAAMKRYREAMTPREYSGLDTIAASLGGITERDMQSGNLGMFLGKLGSASLANRDKFIATEQAKAKMLLDEEQQNLKSGIDEAKIAQSALDKQNRASSLAKNVDNAATQYAMQAVKDLGKDSTEEERDKIFARAYEEKFLESLNAASVGLDDATYNQMVNRFHERKGNLKRPRTTIPVEKLTDNEFAQIDYSLYSPEDQATLRGQFDAYQKYPSEQTRTRLESTITKLNQKIGTVSPPTTVSRVTPTSLEANKAGVVEQRRTNADVTEKGDRKAFEENVAVPYAASQNLKQGVDQFINISSRASGLDSPKLKELAATEAGKWAETLLPKGHPLIADITNAQTAETLTQSMVQAILQAAKGVQTEGDAERAKNQIPSLGKDPKANAEFQAYVNEVMERQKIRHDIAQLHNRRNKTWEGFDDSWQKSLYMDGVDGVRPQGLTKWVGSSPRGFTEYLRAFSAQHGERFGEGTVKAAIQSWNKLK